MKKLLLLLVVGFLLGFGILAFVLASGAGAATLQVSGTTPTQYVANGTCSAPSFASFPSPIVLTVHIWWWQAGADSTSAAVAQDSLAALVPGTPFSFSKQVPAGVYRIRGLAAWGFDTNGCDTTITKLVKGPPWKPSLN